MSSHMYSLYFFPNIFWIGRETNAEQRVCLRNLLLKQNFSASSRADLQAKGKKSLSSKPEALRRYWSQYFTIDWANTIMHVFSHFQSSVLTSLGQLKV
ncbi:hypothetical protein CDAR_7571 [Caerostris darwini]|uniref:Maturase K n=1 Tax=Caerostris darwini TaxID=1538125 RepID=A0AAV4RBF8_9ARAC|nr:hypothetical protein CDAR_7571 [Caerostris darwini]